MQETARRQLEDQIRLDYGRHLLRAHKYEEAMLAFSMSRASTPADVLRSFPFLVPSRLLQALGPPGTDAGEPSRSRMLCAHVKSQACVLTARPFLLQTPWSMQMTTSVCGLSQR